MLLKTQTIITSLLSHSSFFGVGSVTRQNIYAVPFHFPSSKWILIAKQSGNLDAMPGLWAVSNVWVLGWHGPLRAEPEHQGAAWWSGVSSGFPPWDFCPKAYNCTVKSSPRMPQITIFSCLTGKHRIWGGPIIQWTKHSSGVDGALFAWSTFEAFPSTLRFHCQTHLGLQPEPQFSEKKDHMFNQFNLQLSIPAVWS